MSVFHAANRPFILNMTSAQADAPHAHAVPRPQDVKRLGTQDLKAALAGGFADWRACRTDVMTMVVVYPIAAMLLAGSIADQGLLPFIFPICAGFALIGPLATLWFAALSRQRERDGVATAAAAAKVFDSSRRIAIQRLALFIVFMFLAWIVVAAVIYGLTLGRSTEAAQAGFFVRVFTTNAGWTMIAAGCLTGAVFAIFSLAVGLISFPLVLDRSLTATEAVSTSLRAAARNPVFTLSWGAVIVTGLVLGVLPGLLGLAVSLPVLGHANWHIYRRMIR